MIDISAVRTQHGLKDIQELVAYGKAYRFINLHVLPSWVSTLAELIQNEPDILVGAPVGFPGGGHTTQIKLAEAKQLLEDGVQEMDIVMNVGRFLSGEYDYVLNELRAITDVVAGRVPTKVIIEINVLTDDQVLKACDLVVASGASFVKTGTGWIMAPLNIERIRMMKRHCGSAIKIKAAGGIRTREEFSRWRTSASSAWGSTRCPPSKSCSPCRRTSVFRTNRQIHSRAVFSQALKKLKFKLPNMRGANA